MENSVVLNGVFLAGTRDAKEERSEEDAQNKMN